MSPLRRFVPLAIALGFLASAPIAAAPGESGEPSSGKAEAPSPAPLPEQPHPITDMLIDLQRIQVRMASGERDAYAMQSEQLKAMGDSILAAKPEIWKYKTETDAAAAYLLSGGQPRVIAKLIESAATPRSESRLLRGALAYAVGREREAQTLLGEIDPRDVSLRLGAQLAYARSVIETTHNPDKAIEMLDLARLLAPGSLVEEAALRREILIVGDRRDGDRVVFLARQYSTRFPNSIYAENFIQGLAAVSIRYGLIDDMAGLRKFETLLTLLKPAQRQAFLISIARSQIINSKCDVAGEAARDVLADLPAGSKEAAAVRLYLAAARVLGEEYAAGLADLKAVDRTKLSPQDQALWQVALHIATHLRDEPSQRAFAEADREDRVAAARSPTPVEPDEEKDPTGFSIRQGERALQEADNLIARGRARP